MINLKYLPYENHLRCYCIQCFQRCDSICDVCQNVMHWQFYHSVNEIYPSSAHMLTPWLVMSALGKAHFIKCCQICFYEYPYCLCGKMYIKQPSCTSFSLLRCVVHKQILKMHSDVSHHYNVEFSKGYSFLNSYWKLFHFSQRYF